MKVLRGFFILLLICLTLNPSPANAFFKKKPKNLDNKNLEIETDQEKLIKKDFYNDTNAYEKLADVNRPPEPPFILINSDHPNNEEISTLNALNQMPQDDKTKFLKAQAYYDMHMWSDSKKALKGVTTKEADKLRYKIRRDDAIRIKPEYSFYLQRLADEFKLDGHRFGINVSKNTENNKNVFMEYNVIVYSSGSKIHANNVVHEFKGGVKARPSEKWEYRSDLGVKAFEYGNGAMIISDSWIKHYFNDKFNLKAGYRRNNVEQSYISAVGAPIDGIFTGRACDNKFYIEANENLPHKFYSYQMGSFGVIYAQNLPTNEYFEGRIGAGKLLYNNPRNKWINTFSADVVSYNSSYQYNLLKIYSSKGSLFGGYFSPAYFNANTLNLKAEGNIKKLHLKYGVLAFGGIQTAITPDHTTPAWGFSPYIAYDLNDNVCINAAYSHIDYASVQRDILTINAVIRLYKKRTKS